MQSCCISSSLFTQSLSRCKRSSAWISFTPLLLAPPPNVWNTSSLSSLKHYSDSSLCTFKCICLGKRTSRAGTVGVCDTVEGDQSLTTKDGILKGQSIRYEYMKNSPTFNAGMQPLVFSFLLTLQFHELVLTCAFYHLHFSFGKHLKNERNLNAIHK